ncbi:proline dehydrogenase family protein [Thermobifida halotolerans]|uniref:proline dehydrogenase n=1 Tax=Thermobifida halotolerans TaxID=483545 RepID=A0A399G053_9ACTN|nr:proline dehydrogenase family protein [Thermobifida halotolerans]UOE19523.1 proline dehydrogenase family protein [Thermobifida halotolerans]
MLRTALLLAARSDRCRAFVERAPLTRGVVTRFVAGATLEEALPVVRRLTTDRLVTLDHLGEDVTDADRAADTVDAYVRLLAALDLHGLTERAEVSVKLSALGQALPVDGQRIALDNARRVCAAADAVGTTVTLDMEDHTTTDSTLEILRELRADFPGTGAVLQAYLRRTEADCRDLAVPGSRVRLCKGAYDEPASVAYRDRGEVDRSYVRCLRVLMDGPGYPMVASHDPRMIRIAAHLAGAAGRDADSYEYQMLYGVRADAQAGLAARGHRVRVYVPYGGQWYGYFMRRLAERPANVAFLARALAGGRNRTAWPPSAV